jgi:hypothetical protein
MLILYLKFVNILFYFQKIIYFYFSRFLCVVLVEANSVAGLKLGNKYKK